MGQDILHDIPGCTGVGIYCIVDDVYITFLVIICNDYMIGEYNEIVARQIMLDYITYM